MADLQYRVAKSTKPEQDALALAALLAPLDVLAFDDGAGATYGTVRTKLERAGTPIGRRRRYSTPEIRASNLPA